MMRKVFAFIVLMLVSSCAMPSGYLPEHRKYGMLGLHLTHMRDSSFAEGGHFVWSIDRVTNYSGLVKEGVLICEFKKREMEHVNLAVHNFVLQPYQWLEFYSSVPMNSRFGVRVRCRIE